MCPKFRAAWWAATLGGLAACGCEAARVRPVHPEDPLLAFRRPVEGRPETAVPRTVVPAEPLAAPNPPLTVAAAKEAAETQPAPEFHTAARPAGPSTGQTTASSAPPTVAATPAARSTVSAGAAPPAMRRQVPEVYGHAPDYGWIQGRLERRFPGGSELRYADPGVEDKWGGKVILADDARLAGFREGDLILVEGELVPDQGPRNAWRHFPEYRVREVWLAQANQ
jgi:hypothetical protein